MALSADWAKQVTPTTGTGTITLGAAYSTGYIQLQSDSRISDGSIVNYTIEDGLDRERGIGTYTASGTTLARTLVQATLVSGTFDDSSPAAITLTGNAIVSISAIADTHNFRGCLLSNSVSQAITNAVGVDADFDTVSIDTDGFHDAANKRILIPANSGIRKIKLTGGLDWAASSGGYRSVRFRKNGFDITGSAGSTIFPVTSSTNTFQSISSPVIDCTDNDYFVMYIYMSSSGTSPLDIEGSALGFFGMEVIE